MIRSEKVFFFWITTFTVQVKVVTLAFLPGRSDFHIPSSLYSLPYKKKLYLDENASHWCCDICDLQEETAACLGRFQIGSLIFVYCGMVI